MNAKELVTKANQLLDDYGEETEVVIIIQEVYDADGEDVEADDLQIHYNSNKKKIIIYG